MADEETKTTNKPVTKDTDKKVPVVSTEKEKVEIKTTPKKEDVPSTSLPPTVKEDKLPSEKEAATTPTAISEPTNTDNPLITEPAADAAPAANVQTTPSDPVVISENEVKNVGNTDGNEKLAEEIEVLTGEIQALEAKIEQLTSGATSAPADSEPSGDVAPINAPQAPATKETPKNMEEDKKEEVPKPPEPIKTDNTSASSEKDFVNKPQQTPTSAVASAKSPNKFNDISAKPKSNEAPADLNPSSEDGSSKNGSGLAIIGEVIAVFGIIIFIILAISPFFKESIGTDTYQAIQQIGWLSAIGSLGIGLILYMFVKGSVLFKILIFILLLVASVLFLAINENSLVSPISGTLDPLLDFYR